MMSKVGAPLAPIEMRSRPSVFACLGLAFVTCFVTDPVARLGPVVFLGGVCPGAR